MDIRRKWSPEVAEKVAHAACRARGLTPPTDFVRFSEAAVFRSGDVAVRVDQGFTDRLTGERSRRMVDYMHSIGVSTIQTAGIPTFTSDDGLNVTFYEFVVESEAGNWEHTLRGFGEQIRRIHDLGDVGFIRDLAHDDMITHYTERKTSGIIRKLEAFRDEPDSTCFTVEQTEFLLARAREIQRTVLESCNTNNHVLVHGDAHLGNSTTVQGRVLVYDFEEAGVAPAFVDHLHVMLADHMFNVPVGYPHFAEGYGKNFYDADDIDAWLELTAYIYIVWAAGLGVVSEKHAFETRERFRFWESGIYQRGISSLTKDDLPYLWNSYM